ncbi:MAG: ATP-binding cassette domain-containing protein [Bryobacteraceae bacterium]
MIQARGLTKTIHTGTHNVEILKGIDLEIPRGQFAAIMGPSGSGKSTLLGLLAGLDTPTSGTILLDGQEITGLAEDDLAVVRGRKIGFVFQSYHLIPTLTAEENVLLPMELVGDGGGETRARELLERVGLADRRDHYPSNSPAASSSGWRWLARSWCARQFCWLTSPPATWIRRTGASSSTCSFRSIARKGLRWCSSHTIRNSRLTPTAASSCVTAGSYEDGAENRVAGRALRACEIPLCDPGCRRRRGCADRSTFVQPGVP